MNQGLLHQVHRLPRPQVLPPKPSVLNPGRPNSCVRLFGSLNQFLKKTKSKLVSTSHKSRSRPEESCNAKPNAGLLEPGTASCGRHAGSGCHAKAMFPRPSARRLSLLSCLRIHVSSRNKPAQLSQCLVLCSLSRTVVFDTTLVLESELSCSVLLWHRKKA